MNTNNNNSNKNFNIPNLVNGSNVSQVNFDPNLNNNPQQYNGFQPQLQPPQQQQPSPPQQQQQQLNNPQQQQQWQQQPSPPQQQWQQQQQQFLQPPRQHWGPPQQQQQPIPHLLPPPPPPPPPQQSQLNQRQQWGPPQQQQFQQQINGGMPIMQSFMAQQQPPQHGHIVPPNPNSFMMQPPPYVQQGTGQQQQQQYSNTNTYQYSRSQNNPNMNGIPPMNGTFIPPVGGLTPCPMDFNLNGPNGPCQTSVQRQVSPALGTGQSTQTNPNPSQFYMVPNPFANTASSGVQNMMEPDFQSRLAMQQQQSFSYPPQMNAALLAYQQGSQAPQQQQHQQQQQESVEPQKSKVGNLIERKRAELLMLRKKNIDEKSKFDQEKKGVDLKIKGVDRLDVECKAKQNELIETMREKSKLSCEYQGRINALKYLGYDVSDDKLGNYRPLDVVRGEEEEEDDDDDDDDDNPFDTYKKDANNTSQSTTTKGKEGSNNDGSSSAPLDVVRGEEDGNSNKPITVEKRTHETSHGEPDKKRSALCKSMPLPRKDSKSTIVKINVGGTVYTLSRVNISKYPNTMLEALVSDDYDTIKDAQGNPFIDRSSEMFKYIAEWIRHGEYDLLSDKSRINLQRLYSEAEFFGLEDLMYDIGGIEIPTNMSIPLNARKCLTEWCNASSFELLYRASDESFSNAFFHTKTRDKSPTLTLIRSGSYIFGGFSDVPWTSPQNPELTNGSGSEFLFSLVNREGVKPIKFPLKPDAKHRNCLLQCERYGPSFGANDKRMCELHISADASTTSHSHSLGFPTKFEGFGYDKNIFAGTDKFQVMEYEVFWVHEKDLRKK